MKNYYIIHIHEGKLKSLKCA